MKHYKHFLCWYPALASRNAVFRSYFFHKQYEVKEGDKDKNSLWTAPDD